MKVLLNFLEATRFLADRVGDARYAHGRPCLSVAVQTATNLIRFDEEADQRVLIAAMLAAYPEEVLPHEEIRELFGEQILQFVQLVHQPAALAIPAFQRLTPESQRLPLEIGRKICIAQVLSFVSEPLPEGEKELLVEKISGFVHTFPQLEAQLNYYLHRG